MSRTERPIAWAETRLARQLPQDVGDAYHALRWTDASLRALRADVEHVPVRDLTAHLDLAYWGRFQIIPREVLAEPRRWPRHAARIDAADLSWPLHCSRIRGRELILDGLHRLARAVRDGVEVLPCMWVSPPALRPMRHSDLEQLHAWLHAPHVLRWWREPLDLEAVRDEYGPRIDGLDPTWMWVIEQGETPVGFLQSFRWVDHPAHARQLGAGADEHGLDLAIGDLARCGRGLGTSTIAAFSDRWLEGRCVVDPEQANARSVRAFLAAGYASADLVTLEGEESPRHVLRLNAGRATPPSH